MSGEIDYKILFEKLADKVRRMRGWQKHRDQRGGYLPRDDHSRMRQLERQVDNILLLDEEGRKIFSKNQHSEYGKG